MIMFCGLLWLRLIVARSELTVEGRSKCSIKWASCLHEVVHQNVLIDTSYFFKALCLVRDTEITLFLLHVLYETFQMLFKSWNLGMSFKQFHKHAKPVMWSVAFICQSLYKWTRKDSQGHFYCNPSLMTLGNCRHCSCHSMNLCGSELEDR